MSADFEKWWKEEEFDKLWPQTKVKAVALKAWQAGRESGREDGLADGREAGFMEGYDSGVAAGQDLGYLANLNSTDD